MKLLATSPSMGSLSADEDPFCCKSKPLKAAQNALPPWRCEEVSMATDSKEL